MRHLFRILFICVSSGIFAQSPIELVEFGYEPAKCRTAAIQNGNAVVYAYAIGGIGPLTYEWTCVNTGATTNNTTWGGLNVGKYILVVSDTAGNSMTDALDVDSLILIPDFEFLSSDLSDSNGVVQGCLPVNLELINTTPAYFAEPASPDHVPNYFSWKFGELPWSDSLSIFESTQYPLFLTSEIMGEFCLSIITPNGCTDTTCKEVQIMNPPAFVSSGKEISITTNSSNQTLSVFSNTIGSYEIKIFDLFGNFIVDLGLVDTYKEVDFFEPDGIYVYHLVDTKSGEVVSSDKFIY